MKKIIFILPFLLFACAVPKPSRSVNEYFYDFRSYAKEGFFITPNSYTQPNTPIGLITIEVYPGYKKKEVDVEDYDGNFKAINYTKERLSGQELLKILVLFTQEKGANGLSNFDSKIIYSPNSDEVEKYVLSGFAIKINQ